MGANNPTSTTPSTTSTNTSEVIDEIVDSTEAEEQGAAEQLTEEVTKEEVPEASKEQAKVEKALKKKLRLKVDGREIEDEIDLENEDELVKKLQFAHVAQKRIAEKAQLEKEVREFIDLLRKDPRKVLSDPNLGIDLKELAKAVIQEDMENSLKSPEVLEKEKLEKELRDLKDKADKDREDFKKKELQRLEEREFERYDNLMQQALEKSDLPKSEYVVKKMADYMLLGLQNDMDLTPEDVLPLVRDEIFSDIKSMFSVMPEKVIEEILGKDVLGKLRKKAVAKAKTPIPTGKIAADTGEKSKKNDKADKKIGTFRDYFGV